MDAVYAAALVVILAVYGPLVWALKKLMSEESSAL